VAAASDEAADPDIFRVSVHIHIVIPLCLPPLPAAAAAGVVPCCCLQVMAVGPQVATPRRVHDGYNIESTVQMLTSLTPEARTMVLASMPADQRWRILEAMKGVCQPSGG